MGNERMGHVQRWHTGAAGSVPRQQWHHQDDRCRLHMPTRETSGNTALHSYDGPADHQAATDVCTDMCIDMCADTSINVGMCLDMDARQTWMPVTKAAADVDRIGNNV